MESGGRGCGAFRPHRATRTILRASSAVPLALALAAATCGPGRTHRDDRYRDLIAALPIAGVEVRDLPPEQTREDFVHVQILTCGGTSLTSLFVHPPSRVAFPLTVHPGATLETAVGVADDAEGSDGVTFIVEAEHRGRRVPLLERRVDPRVPEQRRWHPVKLDLGALAGEEIRLVLRTEPGPEPTADWAGFASPQVVSDGVHRPGAGFEPRSAVLVSLDTLRVDRLGAFGHPEPLSPHIDAFLRTSRLYPDAHAPSHWTLPSHASLMTATHVDVHRASGKSAIDARLPTLAEVLSSAGYRTAAFVTDIGWLDTRYGFDRGFQTYVQTVEPSSHRIRRVREHLERLRGRRVLLWVHFFDAHSDYATTAYEASPEAAALIGLPPETCVPCPGGASAELAARNKRGERLSAEQEELLGRTYTAGIHDLDHAVGKLLGELAGVGILPGAGVVLFSDHGEELGEHGMYLHDQAHAEVTQALLAVRLPDPRAMRNAGGAGIVPGLPSLVDVAPTVARWAGVTVPGSWQGQSLLGGAGPGEAYAVSETGQAILRGPRRTVILDRRGGVAFDRDADPGEQHPVPLGDGAPELARVRAIRDAHEAVASRLSGGAPVSLTAEEIQRLRELGYIQ